MVYAKFVLQQFSDLEFTISEGKEFHSYESRKERELENILSINFGYSILECIAPTSSGLAIRHNVF